MFFVIGINVNWFRQSWFDIANVDEVIFFFNSYAVNSMSDGQKFLNENISLRYPVDNFPCL